MLSEEDEKMIYTDDFVLMTETALSRRALSKFH